MRMRARAMLPLHQDGPPGPLIGRQPPVARLSAHVIPPAQLGDRPARPVHVLHKSQPPIHRGRLSPRHWRLPNEAPSLERVSPISCVQSVTNHLRMYPAAS